MHSHPRNLVIIGRAVVYYARSAHAFSAGIKVSTVLALHYHYCKYDLKRIDAYKFLVHRRSEHICKEVTNHKRNIHFEISFASVGHNR